MKTSPKLIDKFNELETHQVELELQNEELRKAQSDFFVSQKSFRDLFDCAPIGYVIISDKGIVLQANLAVAKILGIERSFLIGQAFSSWIDKDSQDEFYLCRKSLLKTGQSHSCEVQLKKNEGSLIYAQLKSFIDKDIDGTSGQFRLIVTDITQQQQSLQKVLGKFTMEPMNNFSNLREHTEAQLKNINKEINPSEFLEIATLIHKLDTYKVQLELQYNELQETHLKLQETYKLLNENCLSG